MEKQNNNVERYTKEQSKVIFAYFTRQVVLFIVAVIFLLAGVIIALSKDFMSLKTNEPFLLIILVVATIFIGLVCVLLSVINYKQMQKFIKNADEINANKKG